MHEAGRGSGGGSGDPRFPHRGPAGGWSAVLDTANFSFVPDDAASVPAGHVGHAHLFINGTDTGILYEPVSHIDELPFGEHDFRVVLNNQEHAEYAITGRPIEARLSPPPWNRNDNANGKRAEAAAAEFTRIMANHRGCSKLAVEQGVGTIVRERDLTDAYLRRRGGSHHHDAH